MQLPATTLPSISKPNSHLTASSQRKEKQSPPKKSRINSHILCTSGSTTFKEKVSEFSQKLSQEELTSTSHNELFDHFKNQIVESAKETALCKVHNHPNWFIQSETILSKLISTKSLAHKRYAKIKLHCESQKP